MGKPESKRLFRRAKRSPRADFWHTVRVGLGGLIAVVLVWLVLDLRA